MKKKIMQLLLCATTMFASGLASAQTVESCTTGGGIMAGGLGSTQVNIPYDPSDFVAGKTTNGAFVCHYSDYISSNHPDWIAAIQQATATWGQILSTNYTVNVYFVANGESSPQYAISSSLLAKGKPEYDAANFTPAITTAAYFANTYYASPLSSYLTNGAVPANQSESAILVIINEHPIGAPGGYNTNVSDNVACPSNKFDLMTVCMMGIGNGVGLLSETDITNGNEIAFAHQYQWPNILEHFMNDNGTGSSAANHITYLKNLGTQQPFLQAFVIDEGDITTTSPKETHVDYFKGPNTNDPLIQMYAPFPYQTGLNLSFLTPNSTALMNGTLPTGRKVHVPSPSEMNMLADIGWQASLATVGDFDDFTITNSDYLAPDVVLSLGNSYSYAPNDYNAYYYGLNISTMQYKLELLDQNGYQLCDSHSGVVAWETNPITLPTGDHTWVRDINGNIEGQVIISAMDLNPQPHNHTTAISVGVQTAPETPIFTVTNNSDGNNCCNSKTLSFYSAGANSYQIYYRSFTNNTWTDWTLAFPGAGDQSYTFNGLDQTATHQFYVIASNTTGSATSNTITTYPCEYNIQVSPNPVAVNSNLRINADASFLINAVTIVNAETGVTAASLKFDGTKPTVSIDLIPYKLPSGVYVVSAFAPNTHNVTLCYASNVLSASLEIRTAY
jgi:hypothetical protein